ncbi:MAG: hypothetical protein ABID61_03885 [Candidatus Micrarchaeota archaeon]
MDSAEAISKLREVASTHPESFPNLANLAGRDGLYTRTALSALIPQEIWDTLQVEWIRTTSEQLFLTAFSSRTIHSATNTVKSTVSQRLLSILQLRLADCPDVFPTLNGVVKLKIPNMTSALFTKVLRSDWDQLQLDWLATSTDDQFLAAIRNMKGTSAQVTTTINTRLLTIIKTRLEANPDVFPHPLNLQKICKLRSRHVFSSRIPKATIEQLQLEWVQKSSEEHFLAALSHGSLSDLPNQTAAIVDARVLTIFKEVSERHPEIFPTYAGLSKVDGLPDTTMLTKKVSKAILEQMQLDWIGTSSQENFVKEFSNNKMTALPAHVNDAINKKLREILIASITSGAPLPLPLKTFKSRVTDFYDVMAVFGFLYGIRSLDQQLVSKIGLRESQREPWVTILMNERLEQLWFFREAVVLAKSGHADNSVVVSFSNDTLPSRLQALAPSVSVTHIQLEALEARPVTLTDRTILLSVAQWLSPERSAILFRNLALSSTDGHTVLFTYPFDHKIMPGAVDDLAKLGFDLVRLGELRLTPLPEIQQEEKLTQISGVGVLKRMSTGPDTSLDKLDLFLRPSRVARVSYSAVTNATRTYALDDLDASNPSLILYPFSTAPSTTLPFLCSIDHANDSAAFILTFSDDSVVGFHVDPQHSCTVEIEGSVVTRGVVNATVAIIEGREPNLSIMGSVQRDYREFITHLRAQKPQIAGLPVLKRRIR